jgi:hypothetical protein
MDKYSLQKLIFLLILKKERGGFDSYSTIRILTRRFDGFNFFKIITDADSTGHVETVKRGLIEGYKLTCLGEKEINDLSLDLKEQILTAFPLQSEFIEVLFD